MEELHRVWGHRVAATRKREGLRQVDLALHARTTQATISRIERGEGAPSDALKYRLAIALNTSVDDLFPFPPIPRAVGM